MAGDTVITVVGNLTGDPELRFTPSGAAVANFTVASTPRSFDKQSNEWKDSDTLFMRCSVWREAAENVAESLTKGMRVIVQGRLVQRSYETREGEKRTVVDLQLDDRALLALAGLVRALDEAALHENPHPLGQGLGNVLGSLAPDGAAHEERVAVLPLVALLVEAARGGRDGEVRDRRPGRGEAQLGVPREVPDHRDDGVTSHASSSCVL